METDQFKTFWQFSKDAAFKTLGTGIDGLDDNEAEKRLKKYGSNTIKANSKYSGILLFLSQFKSPVTIMLSSVAIRVFRRCYGYGYYLNYRSDQQLSRFLAGKRCRERGERITQDCAAALRCPERLKEKRNHGRRGSSWRPYSYICG